MKEKIPNFYINNEFQDFTDLFENPNFQLFKLKRGQVLTTLGKVNNTSYFIKKGIIRFSLINSDGKEKTISLFGKNEIFPIGVKTHHHKMDYEMVLTAFTDLEIYKFSYSQLRELTIQHPKLASRLLEVDCDFISYLFYITTSLAFSNVLTRISDILFLSIPENRREHQVEVDIIINQGQLSALAGASQPEVERALRTLRKNSIIKTNRGKITIQNITKLKQHCSANI